MMQKYEQKRWYVQPTDEMYADARRVNQTSTGSQADVGTVVVSSVSRPVYQVDFSFISPLFLLYILTTSLGAVLN